MGEPPTEISKADYEALHAFRYALRRFLHFSEEGARAAGLTAQQQQLLLAVKGQPGRDWATITDLAESLQILHHAAVGLVDRCERAGLVVSKPHREGRRNSGGPVNPESPRAADAAAGPAAAAPGGDRSRRVAIIT